MTKNGNRGYYLPDLIKKPVISCILLFLCLWVIHIVLTVINKHP
jgi:hypothetical protein